MAFPHSGSFVLQICIRRQEVVSNKEIQLYSFSIWNTKKNDFEFLVTLPIWSFINRLTDKYSVTIKPLQEIKLSWLHILRNV
jgi:hypothetical protein